MTRRLAPPPGRLGDPWLGALVALLALTFAALTYLGRDTTFQYDDWAYWQMSQSYAPSELFGHYNGQLSLVPKLVWFTTTHLFGGGEYAPFRIGAILMHLATLAGIFAVMRPRVGPAVAFATLLPLALVGGASLTLLMADTFHYFGLPVLWLAWAVVALDRDSRRGDVVACVLLVLSVLTSTMGLTPLAAVAAYLAWGEPRWRRLWILAPPALVFVLWFLVERPEQVDVITYGDFLNVPLYIAAGASDGLARYTSLNDWATTLSVAGLGVWVWALASGRRLDRGAVAFGAGAVTLWALISIGRGPETKTSSPQYLFPDIVYAVVAVVLLASAATALRSRRVAIIALVLGVAFALPSAQLYRDEARTDRAEGQTILAGISAVNVLADEDPAAAERLDPPQLTRRDKPFEPAVYLRRLAEGREPIGVRPYWIPRQSEAFRGDVDRFLAEALGAQQGAAELGDARGPAPRTELSQAAITREGSCILAGPRDGFAVVTVPAQTPVIVAPEDGDVVDLRPLRFASTALPTTTPLISSKSPVRFAPRPIDGGRWRLNVQSAAAFRVCSA